jgi:hypothetical protein
MNTKSKRSEFISQTEHSPEATEAGKDTTMMTPRAPPSSSGDGTAPPQSATKNHKSPEKYSKAYFENRIKVLRAKISRKIPTKDELIPATSVFCPLLKSLQAASQVLESTKAVSSALQKEQRKHPEDDGWKDSTLVDPAKQAIDSAKSTVESLEEAATTAGCSIVADSGLLDGRLLAMEADLLECTVLIQATPQALADWCAESPSVHGPLLDRFLDSDERRTMVAFFKAGAPSNGNYGSALVLYDKLLHDEAYQDSNPLLQRLALAVALELATPIPIFKQQDAFVDPLERFRYYAKFASVRENGDTPSGGDALDAAFSTLSVWELRKVVNANATHEDLTWGREFLRNYRPDQVYMEDQKWRYVRSVRTDVGYRHPDHEFTNYKELLSAGGECGPRAFFGRFIAKAWGLPTWGVRQPGHAAMTRWTSDVGLGGWTVCLGAGWEFSWWEDDRYGGQTRHGPDFLEETRARTAGKGSDSYYETVVLFECLAECLGETVVEDFSLAKPWRSLALAQRKQLAREFGVAAAALERESASEGYNASARDEPSVSVKRASHCERVWIRLDGTIVIPAASFVNPEKPSDDVLVMKSFLGGDQLHLEHGGSVEYKLPSTGGSFALSAKVVNVHRDQKPVLVNIVNNNLETGDDDDDDGFELIHLPQGQELEIQYTGGVWEETKSIRVELSSGDRLKLSRNVPCWGLSIKEIFLRPI